MIVFNADDIESYIKRVIPAVLEAVVEETKDIDINVKDLPRKLRKLHEHMHNLHNLNNVGVTLFDAGEILDELRTGSTANVLHNACSCIKYALLAFSTTVSAPSRLTSLNFFTESKYFATLVIGKQTVEYFLRDIETIAKLEAFVKSHLG